MDNRLRKSRHAWMTPSDNKAYNAVACNEPHSMALGPSSGFFHNDFFVIVVTSSMVTVYLCTLCLRKKGPQHYRL